MSDQVVEGRIEPFVRMDARQARLTALELEGAALGHRQRAHGGDPSHPAGHALDVADELDRIAAYLTGWADGQDPEGGL